MGSVRGCLWLVSPPFFAWLVFWGYIEDDLGRIVNVYRAPACYRSVIVGVGEAVAAATGKGDTAFCDFELGDIIAHHIKRVTQMADRQDNFTVVVGFRLISVRVLTGSVFGSGSFMSGSPFVEQCGILLAHVGDVLPGEWCLVVFVVRVGVEKIFEVIEELCLFVVVVLLGFLDGFIDEGYQGFSFVQKEVQHKEKSGNTEHNYRDVFRVGEEVTDGSLDILGEVLNEVHEIHYRSFRRLSDAVPGVLCSSILYADGAGLSIGNFLGGGFVVVGGFHGGHFLLLSAHLRAKCRFAVALRNALASAA